MIPKDILIYFGSAIENVISCQVLQRLNNPRKYVALLKMRTAEDAQRLVRDYHGQSLCSLEPTTCWLYEVVSVRVRFTVSVQLFTCYKVTHRLV